MPVSLEHMRAQLLPGLWETSAARCAAWDKVFAAGQAIEPVSLPAITPQVAVAMGAAAVIVRNPVVSRRFWQFWKSP